MSDEQLREYLNSLLDYFESINLKPTVRLCLDELKLKVPDFKVDYNRFAGMLSAVKKSRTTSTEVDEKYWEVVTRESRNPGRIY